MSRRGYGPAALVGISLAKLSSGRAQDARPVHPRSSAASRCPLVDPPPTDSAAPFFETWAQPASSSTLSPPNLLMRPGIARLADWIRGRKLWMAPNSNFATLRGTWRLAPLLMGALIVGACSGGLSASSITSGTTPVAGSRAPATATTSQGAKASGNADCQRLVNSAFDLNTSQTFLVALAGGGGSMLNTVDAPFHVDTAKLRADFDVLTALADPTDPTEVAILGKPSEAILQYRQMLDLVDAEAKAGPTPDDSSTPDDSALGQQLLGFTSKLIKMSSAINNEVGNECPDTSPVLP